MKISLLLIIIVNSISYTLSSQNKDTNLVKSSWYARVMPYNIYTGSGIRPDRISQSIEVGRSYGVMDFGISYGRISLRPDSTQFVEAKVTMNLAQYGRFSNEMVIGCGYIMNSPTKLMLELSYTIYGQVSKHVSIGIITGYYDFSGESQSYDKNFFGLCIRYGLQRNDNGGLLKPHSRMKHHR